MSDSGQNGRKPSGNAGKGRPKGSKNKLPDLMTEKRIEHIADMMRNLKFRTGRTVKELAEEWDLGLDRVKQLSAEASRRVRAEIVDPEQTSMTVCMHLEAALDHANKTKDYRQTAQLAKTWAEIVGAMAPKRTEVLNKSDLPDDPKALLAIVKEEFAKRGYELTADDELPGDPGDDGLN